MLLLGIVVAAPVVASWHGLTALGRDWLGLGPWALLVPLVLDAAALYAAYLSLRSTLAGDAAGADRLLVWVYAGLSAALNMWHADAVGGLAAAMFFGVASISAALMWERTLRAIRRRELRALGAVDAPSPRFRLLRWLLHTRETWGAFTTAVGAGVSDSRTALQLYRLRLETDRLGDEAAQAWDEAAGVIRHAAMTRDQLPTATPAPGPPSPRAGADRDDLQREDGPEVPAELAGLSQAEALRHAFAAVGAVDVRRARSWLADRGVHTDKSGAYKTARRVEAEQAGGGSSGQRLSVVPGAGSHAGEATG